MSANAFAGYKGIARASTAAGGAKVKIAELRDWKVRVEMNETDATSHDSSGGREIIQGVQAWSADVDYCQVMSTAGASLSGQFLYDVLKTPTLVDFEFYPTGSSGDGGWNGSGFITDWELGSPLEGPTITSVQIKGSGLLNRSASS